MKKKYIKSIKFIISLVFLAILLALFSAHYSFISNLNAVIRSHLSAWAFSSQNTDGSSAGSFVPQSIPVISYGAVINQSNEDLQNLREELFALKQAGYQTMTLAQFQNFTAGNKPLEQKSLLVVFNAIDLSAYYSIDPILKSLNYHVVIFTSGNLSTADTGRMTTDGSWEMAGANALKFVQIDPQKGFSQNYPEQSGNAKEIMVHPEWTFVDLLSVLQNGAAKPLPYKDALGSYLGWTAQWGNVEPISGGLNLAGTGTSTGSGIILDGSRLWTDYSYQASMHWGAADTVTLFARYQDPKNYEACVFSQADAKVMQSVNGVQKTFLNGSGLALDPEVTLGIQVVKDKIECLINGNVVAYSYGADSSLSKGGIGIGIWSKTGNRAMILLHSVQVSSYNTADDYSKKYDIIRTTVPTSDQSDTSAGDEAGVQKLVFPVTTPETFAFISSGQDVYAIPVLLYHGIVNKADGGNVTTANFRAQMDALKQDGWHSVSIYDYNDFIQGKKSLPPKSFLITFDDGRLDSWKGADPALAADGFQATIFAIVDRIGINTNYQLTLDQLKEMEASGRWQVQSHSVRAHDFYFLDPQDNSGHFLSSKFWLPVEGRYETDAEFSSRLQNDLTLARSSLENDFGKPIVSFAYPFSDYGEDTTNFTNAENLVLPIVQNLYDLAFYQMDPTHMYAFNYPEPGQFMQKRIEVHPDWTAGHLIDLLDSQMTKTLPYSISSFDKNAWLRDWGEISVSPDGSLELSASASTTGSMVFLAGGDLWTNYEVKTSVVWNKGASFGILARVADPSNFVYCDFSDHYVRIVNRVNGIDTTLLGESSPNAGSGIQTLGARVYGKKIACEVNGKDIATAITDDVAAGGIGFTTWDGNIGDTSFALRSLLVSPVVNDITLIPPPSDKADSSAADVAAPPKPISLPYMENNFSSNANWQKVWGSVAIASSSGNMHIDANSSTTGGTAALAGGNQWADYTFTATVDWTAGETFSLMARYANDDNYVMCEFDREAPGSIILRLQQYINGVRNVIVEGSIPDYGQKYDIASSIEVQGTQGVCTFDGHVVSSVGSGGTINPPYNGGIGVTDWDPHSGISKITVKSVSVKEIY